MRVALISKTYVAAPAQRLLEYLAADVDLTLITPDRWRTDDGGWLAFEPAHAAGYRVAPLSVRRNGHFHQYTYRGLAAALAAARPEVVHIDEEPYNPAAWQALRLARRLGVPALAVAWQNVARRYPPPYGWGERWAYRRLAGIVAGSQSAAAVVRGKGYDGPLTVFGLHGIDPDLWPPRCPEPPAPDAPFVVGYAGRLVPEKGVAVLLAALARLPARARLRIIGRGPQADELRRLADDLGVAARVEWRDFVPPAGMPATLAALDALALPSLTRPGWAEQFGRVLAEAMGAGVPVVGAASGEIPGVIADAGLIVPPGDAGALAAALARLADEPALWRDLARRGQARARATFTQKAAAGRLAAFYAILSTGAQSAGEG